MIGDIKINGIKAGYDCMIKKIAFLMNTYNHCTAAEYTRIY